MIDIIKRKLLEEPQHIVNILEYYNFHSIRLKTKEITCALEEGWNANAIHIKLEDNPYIFVNDYARGMNNKDIINYIIIQKNIEFKDLILKFKEELGLQDGYYESSKREVFGGFYKNVKRKRNNNYEQKIYDKSIMDNYLKIQSLKFLEDHISIEIQKKYVWFDVENQRFVFPIYDYMGNIIGIKGRTNSKDEIKYIYTLPCNNSETLYGYWQNYTYMQNSDVIICESEKAFMQAESYDYHNVVSIGCSTISPRQAQLIMMLNPKRICVANDTNIGMDIIQKNINTLKAYSRYRDVEITYWNYEKSKYIEQFTEDGEVVKDCITDRGKEIFYKILEEEMFVVNENIDKRD